MDTRQFLDMLAAGQSAEAKSALEELLSARALEALEAKKQEVASSLYTGREEESEQEEQPEIETETEETTE
jgi:restriction endonuclease S subunit